MTVAERRQRQFRRFVEERKLNEEEQAKLKTLINSYYRLCGLEERILQWENSQLWNRGFVQRAMIKRDKWVDSLDERFNKFDLGLVYFGYLPTICYKGTTETAIDKIFYE